MKLCKFDSDFKKILGYLNLLIMLKEPINVIINEIEISHPESILYDSKNNNVILKSSSQLAIINFEDIENIQLERINDYDE